MNMMEKFTLADEVMEDLLQDMLVKSTEEVLVALTYRSGTEQGEAGYLGYRPNSRRLFCFVPNKDHAVKFRRLTYKGGADYLECDIGGQPHYLDYQAEGGAIFANASRLWSVGWQLEDDMLMVGVPDRQPLALCPDYEPVMMPVLYASLRLTPFRVKLISA